MRVLAHELLSESNVKTYTIREEAELTTLFVESETFIITGSNQLQLLVSFTKGNSDGCRIKIEFSKDKVKWYQESSYSFFQDVSVVHKPAYRELWDSSDIIISVPISATFMRVSCAAITTGDSTSLSIMATIDRI